MTPDERGLGPPTDERDDEGSGLEESDELRELDDLEDAEETAEMAALDAGAAWPRGDTVRDRGEDDDAGGMMQTIEPASTQTEPALDATAIFLDSSAIVALVDRDDASHAAAVDAYRNLVQAGYKLFTTNYVIAETFDLLRTGVGPLVARQFLRDCKLAIYHADEQDERRARRHVLDSPSGSNLTLVDAVSLVVMERLGVADAFAVDPSFLGNGD